MDRTDPLLREPDELRDRLEPDEIETLAEIIDQTYEVMDIRPFDEEDVRDWFREPSLGPVGRALDTALDAAFGDEDHPDYAFRDRNQERALEEGFQLAIQHPRPDWGQKGFRSEIDALGRRFHNLGVTSSYKSTYVDDEEEYIMHIPRDGDALEDRLERVLTWEHNAETMAEHGVTPASDYDVAIIEMDDRPFPVLFGQYRSELTRERELDEERLAAYDDTIQRYAETLQELLDEDLIASHHPREYRRGSGTSEYAVDEQTGELVVLDVGELAMAGQERERFLQEHGIRERVDAYLADP